MQTKHDEYGRPTVTRYGRVIGGIVIGVVSLQLGWRHSTHFNTLCNTADTAAPSSSSSSSAAPIVTLFTP
jgi:hypothetical protein